MGQQAGQVLAPQAVEELLQQLAVGPGAVEDGRGRGAVGRPQQSNTVDEDAPGAHLLGGLEEHTVRGAEFLVEHLGAGDDDLEPVLLLERVEVPAEGGRIAQQQVRVGLEDDDEARLVVERSPPGK